MSGTWPRQTLAQFDECGYVWRHDIKSGDALFESFVVEPGASFGRQPRLEIKGPATIVCILFVQVLPTFAPWHEDPMVEVLDDVPSRESVDLKTRELAE